MSADHRSRAYLFVITSTLALAVACSDQSIVAPSRPTRVSPAAPSRSITLSSAEPFMLSAIVSGSGIEQPLVYNMPLVDGKSEASLPMPAGDARYVVVRAHDQYGNVTHEGKLELYGVMAGENKPASLVLRPVREGKEMEISLGVQGEKSLRGYSVVIESEAKQVLEGQTMKLRAYLVDGLGNRRSVDPSMIHWSVDDLRGGRMRTLPEGYFEFIAISGMYKTSLLAIIGDKLTKFFPEVIVDPYVDVSAGESHTCAIRQSGAMYCWGFNTNLQLGSSAVATCGVTLYCADRPTLVPGAQDWRSVSAGAYHTCAIDKNKAAFCWGLGSDGQLGSWISSGARETVTPLQIAGKTFDVISAGLYQTCGIDTNGAGWCWGSNAQGELGNGKATGSGPTPVAISGGQTWRQINASFWFTCGRNTNNETY